MIGSFLYLALQAATAQPAMVSPAEAPAQEQPAETQTVATAAAPAEPPRKRVCRTVVDTRTGIVGKRSKVCRYVDEES